MSSLDYLDLCRLCLVKDRVSVPIFGGEGNDLFLKIAACLPVKVGREDKLPKKICDDCVYKVELFYEFWNTTANAEKRLLQWLGEVNVESGKQGYVPNVLNPNVMKQEQSTENRLDGSVMQQVGEHQNNMGMSMMDNMGLGIPMMIPNTNQQQQITSVPMDTSGSPAQNVQAVPGPSSQTTHNQISQNQTSSTQQEDEEESSEDDENSDDECDGDEGLPVKEESEEDPNSRTIEPTTFVNVSLACDEAGPSGLQQQKITDMPEMPISQSADGDPKTGSTLDPYEDAQNVDESCAWKILNVFTLADNTPMDCDQSPEKLIKNSGYDLLSLDEKYKLLVSSPTQKWPYPCPMCTFKTRNKNTLRDHILRLHIDECAYSCEICADEFKVKADLTQHLKTEHTTKKCFICGIVFKYHRSFVGHMKRKHANHPYQCAKCNHYSESLAALKKHEKWHAKMKKRSVVTCPKCGKQVRDYNVLTHMFKHNDMMSNMCPICGKRVQKPSAMQVHLLTHSGIKPYVCGMCGKKFSQKVWLLKHWTRQHPGPQPSVPTISLKEIVTDFLETYKHVKQDIN